MNRATIFADVKEARGNKGYSYGEIVELDMLLDKLGVPRDDAVGQRPSKRAIDLIHDFETCVLDAYPDPGSKDGNPWTIGWGSTGPGIQKGVRWTQEQADARFEQDIEKRVKWLNDALGDAPTSQAQYDALFSLGYNIGFGPKDLGGSTLMRLHKAGDHAGAAAQFARWNRNDGKVMNGLIRRRAAEAAMYRGMK